jgi:hypothetical protein
MRGQMTHPDSEVLAEFRAGIITGRRGARISAHLASCDRCTGVCDQLAEISVLLAAVPASAMPGAVAQRIESALAAEAMQRDSAERAVDPRSPDRATSPPPRRHWDFRLVALRVLAPAAAVVLLAAGGYGLSRIASSPTSSVAAGSQAASASSSAQAGAAAVPSSAAKSEHGAGPAVGAQVKFGILTSKTYYLRATLRQQLERELRLHPSAPGNAQELAPGSVNGCVLLVTRGISPVTLLLVEKAHFQGQPANVIVAVSGDHDTAWVTTPACSGGGDHILAATTLPGTSAP